MPSLRNLVATAIVMLIGIPTAATATPIDVVFQGIRPASDPQTAFGIGLAQATTANQSFGVPILTDLGPSISTVGGILSVTLPPASSIVIDPDPPTSSLNHAQSTWGVQNVSGADLLGASYLLFTHTDPFTLPGGQLIDYPDENVGIQIDVDLGWVIVRATDNDANDYYYPALLLDRAATNPLDGMIAQNASVLAQINYVVSQPLIEAGLGTGSYALPELQIGFAQAVIPEPATALLFGLGLAVLAGHRKQA